MRKIYFEGGPLHGQSKEIKDGSLSTIQVPLNEKEDLEYDGVTKWRTFKPIPEFVTYHQDYWTGVLKLDATSMIKWASSWHYKDNVSKALQELERLNREKSQADELIQVKEKYGSITERVEPEPTYNGARMVAEEGLFRTECYGVNFNEIKFQTDPTLDPHAVEIRNGDKTVARIINLGLPEEETS